MKPRIVPIDIPPSSQLFAEAKGSYFHDAFEIELDTTGQSAMSLYLSVAVRTPRWIDVLMALRNRIVSLVGLKDLGQMGALDRSKPADAYRVGDRVGIFTVRHLAHDEIVLGDADKHLDVKVSVRKLAQGARHSVAVSTVVYVHNTLGKVYMAFVAPVHKRITPAMLARFPGATH
ncbi:MAG: hypothetical protein RLZZ618_2081 [Pseudomonadota bacterium]|jgi:hypothetical protein